jgi:hypothetical protein
MEIPCFIYKRSCVKSLSKEGTADLGPCVSVKYSVQLLKLQSFTAIVVFVAEIILELSI